MAHVASVYLCRRLWGNCSKSWFSVFWIRHRNFLSGAYIVFTVITSTTQVVLGKFPVTATNSTTNSWVTGITSPPVLQVAVIPS